jgi:3-carboxy-cis,cis-muconate cycloisomerase
VGATVAPLLEDKDGRTGKEQLQAVVDRTLQVPAAEQAGTYRLLLREAVPLGKLTDLRLEQLLDPASYLGQAGEISGRILAAFPDFALSPSDSSARNTSAPSTSSPNDANGANRG